MKLSAVVMFISFLLYQRGIAEIKPDKISRNDTLGMIYWHFHLKETLDSARQICNEYRMTLFSISRQKNSFLQHIYEKIVNILDGSKGYIMLEAFVCQRHWEHGSDYFHQIEDGEITANMLQSVKGNHFQCAFYCSITKKCAVYHIFSHMCILYSKCAGICPKVICLKHRCFAKV